MDDFTAIIVIACVAWVAGKVFKGIGGFFGKDDFRRDR